MKKTELTIEDGGTYILVNSAGITCDAMTNKMKEKQFDQVIALT